MIPVKQTILTTEEGANCMAACLASILEVPLDDVPNAAVEWRKGTAASLDRGWELLRSWLASLGLGITNFGDEQELEGWRPSGYWLAGIDSPRFPGESHVVVAYGPVLVFDPHPSVAEPDQAAAIRFCYVLSADDPARTARELPLRSRPIADELRPYLRPSISRRVRP